MKIYKVLIVEDELPAQANLKRALEKNFEDLEVIGTASSVKGTVEWLSQPENHADIIFMDVELSDGMCFNIFSQIEIKSKVVITTAYDNYAIKAFRVNTIDYLLKPIDLEELKAAVGRCREALAVQTEQPQLDIASLRSALTKGEPQYKERFIIKIGDHLTVVNVNEIAYFYTENKSTFLVTRDKHNLILDNSLDSVSEQVDPKRFFRISRNCTVAIDAITDISRHITNRLKLQLNPPAESDIFVSRSKTNDFLDWLEGSNKTN